MKREMLTHGQPLASQVVRLASRLLSETSTLSKSDRELLNYIYCNRLWIDKFIHIQFE